MPMQDSMLLETQAANNSLKSTVQAIAAAVHMRDAYTCAHSRRTAKLSVAIAREIGMAGSRIEGLSFAGVIHDVGKISVPAEILGKSGRLIPPEFEILKIHPRTGYEIIKGIAFDRPVAETVLQHHERLDGSGYPNGLKGDAILAEAKILAVADVVEAMTSHRPYRAALNLDVALTELENGKGRLYDPAVVDACIALFKEKGFLLECADARKTGTGLGFVRDGST